VDDDRDFVDAVKAVFESGGYQVEVAYDGAACLPGGPNRPDLISSM